MKRIPVKRRGAVVAYAKVDDEDFAALAQISWTLDRFGYARCPVYAGKPSLMHRIITGNRAGVVDHKNSDRLDNRKENLRVCSHTENQRNRRGAGIRSKSGVLGVIWLNRCKRWRAQIQPDGRTIHLGYFVCLDDAIEARAAAEQKYYGKFAPIREDIKCAG